MSGVYDQASDVLPPPPGPPRADLGAPETLGPSWPDVSKPDTRGGGKGRQRVVTCSRAVAVRVASVSFGAGVGAALLWKALLG